MKATNVFFHQLLKDQAFNPGVMSIYTDSLQLDYLSWLLNCSLNSFRVCTFLQKVRFLNHIQCFVQIIPCIFSIDHSITERWLPAHMVLLQLQILVLLLQLQIFAYILMIMTTEHTYKQTTNSKEVMV